jgi:acyl-CoA reductase-like NAD-dependent aldehyde dehydrogenase
VCEEVVTTAYNSWRKTTALDRSRVMKRLAALMAENLDDLAAIVTLEAGKPLAEARGEIQAGA